METYPFLETQFEWKGMGVDSQTKKLLDSQLFQCDIYNKDIFYFHFITGRILNDKNKV